MNNYQTHKKNYLTIAFFLFASICQAQWKEETYLTDDSVRITYYIKGTGAPMLIIPGGPGYDASYLLSLADTLAKELPSYHYKREPLQFTYIIPDLRGTGKSKIAAGDIERKVNFKNVITDLEQLRNKLGYQHWAVTGHSFGGLLAQYYSCLFPEAIDHMVLLSTPDLNWKWSSTIDLHKILRLTSVELALLDTLQSKMKKGGNIDSLKLAYDRVMLPVYIFQRADTLKIMEILKEVTINMAVFNKMVAELYGNYKFITVNLPAIKMPVMILHGRMDPMGEGVAYENQKLIPHAIISFSNNGHFLWVENSYQVGNAFNAFF